MKVGLRSLYLDTLGGGERYFFSAAEFFLNRGDDVTIFWDKQIDLDAINNRYRINLKGVKISEDIFSTPVSVVDKLITTREYDLLFFLSDGSIPSTIARKNILHFQVPFNNSGAKSLANKIKLSRFQHVICNSAFTKKYIDNSYGIRSEVIYPPVDVDQFIPGRKEKLILSVGRFFSPSHPKKQEVLVETFKKIYPKISEWRLVLLGGMTLGSQDAVLDLKDKARGFPIQIITDVSFTALQKYYSLATIYWHAAGFGENLRDHPDLAEHFGITSVEAMAAGAVPIVFAGGGQVEIVKAGETGYLWTTPEELAKTTLELISSKKKLLTLSAATQKRAQFFSKARFCHDLEKIVG